MLSFGYPIFRALIMEGMPCHACFYRDTKKAMSIFEVQERLSSGEDLVAEIMRNPEDLTEWLIWIRESSGKSFMLSNNDGSLIRSTDTTQNFYTLKSIGFRQATVIF